MKETVLKLEYDTAILKSASSFPCSGFCRLHFPLFEIHLVFVLILLEHSLPFRELPRKDPLLPMENDLILKDSSYPVQFGSVDVASEMVCSEYILTFLPRMRLSMKYRNYTLK